jgi:uncharacterized protein with NRDE domain
MNLGRLLQEVAKKPAKKKPAAGAVTVTVKTGASGGQAAGDKNKAKKKSSAAGQKSEGKMLRDLLAHHDSASIYHRQKSAEHQEFSQFHNKSRTMRHLGPLHKKAQETHEQLRHIYHKLSNATYNAIRSSDKKPDEKKAKKK